MKNIKAKILAIGMLSTIIFSGIISNTIPEKSFSLPLVYSKNEKDKDSTQLDNQDINNASLVLKGPNGKGTSLSANNASKTKVLFKDGINLPIGISGEHDVKSEIDLNANYKHPFTRIDSVTFPKGDVFDVYRTIKMTEVWNDYWHGEEHEYDESASFWGFDGLNSSNANIVNPGNGEGFDWYGTSWDEVKNKKSQYGTSETSTIVKNGDTDVLVGSGDLLNEYKDTDDNSNGNGGYKGSTTVKLYATLKDEKLTLNLKTNNVNNFQYENLKNIFLRPVSISGQKPLELLKEYNSSLEKVESDIDNSVINGVGTKNIWTSKQKFSDLDKILKRQIPTVANISIPSTGWKISFYKDQAADNKYNITDFIDSPDFFYRIEPDGSNLPLIPQYEGSTSTLNQTNVFPIHIPFVKNYSLNSKSKTGFSTSGQKDKFKIVKSKEYENKYDIYTNNDLEFSFVSDGWLKLGSKGFDGNREENYSLDFDIDRSKFGDESNNWIKEAYVSNAYVSSHNINVNQNGIIQSENKDGYWIKTSIIDDIYKQININIDDQKNNLIHTLFRWTYLFSGDELAKNSKSLVGQKFENDNSVFKAYQDNSLNEAIESHFITPVEIGKSFRFDVHYDSTPLLGDEINSSDDFIYSATPQWVEGKNTDNIVNPYWSTETYDPNTGYDAFGNHNLNNSDTKGIGLGDNPFLSGETDGPSDYARFINDSGNVGWFLDDQGSTVKWNDDKFDWGIHDKDGKWYNQDQDGTDLNNFNKNLWGGMFDKLGNSFSDESLDDVRPHEDAVGQKIGTSPEHIIMKEKDNSLEDYYLFQLNTGTFNQKENKWDLDSNWTLNDFLGKNPNNKETKWSIDEEKLIKSNVNIASVDSYSDDWIYSNGADLNNPKSLSYASKTIYVNKGNIDGFPEFDFKVVVTPWQTPDDSLEDRFEHKEGTINYLESKDGKNLIKNMQQRMIFKQDSTATYEQMSKDVNLAFDAESLFQQISVFDNSKDVATYDTTKIIQQLSNLQIPSNNQKWSDVPNLKIKNSITNNQKNFLKSEIRKLLIDNDAYTKDFYGNIINNNEWSIDTGSIYEVVNKSGSNPLWGSFDSIKKADLDEYGELTPEATRRIVNKNYSNWSFPSEKNIDKSTSYSKIPDSLFSINPDSLKIDHKKNFALQVEVKHQPTKNSTMYGNKNIYVPLWVTDKAERTIPPSLTTEFISKWKQNIFNSISVSGKWKPFIDNNEFNTGFWNFVDPTKRPIYSAGNLINPNDPNGMGDDKTTDVDESKDDVIKNIYFKRNQIVSSLYNQTYYETIGDGKYKKDSYDFIASSFYKTTKEIWGMGEEDVGLTFGISTYDINDLNKKVYDTGLQGILLNQDTLDIYIKPNKNVDQSKWIIHGETIIKGIEIPDINGLTTPEKQPPIPVWHMSMITKILIILISIFVLLIMITIITLIFRIKKNKKLV